MNLLQLSKIIDFITIWPNRFEENRFCTMFGVDPKNITEGKMDRVLIENVGTNKLAEILEFLRLWNTNAFFLDNEEIWRRARQSRQSTKSNLIHDTFLVTSNFLRSTNMDSENTFIQLNKLRCLPGIDYIDFDCKEDDLVVPIEIGAETQHELEKCVARVQLIFDRYLDTLAVHGICDKGETVTDRYLCIPYACDSHKLYNRFSEESYLETLSSDPEVTLVELDEIEQTLTLGCSSQARLDKLLFEVRGWLSFFRALSWRKKYHANFRVHIKASNELISEMNVEFLNLSFQTEPCLSTDFLDFVTDSDSLTFMKLSKHSGFDRKFFKYDPYSVSSYTLYCKSSMLSRFRGFLDIDDFSILCNIKTYTRFGTTLYKITPDLKQKLVPVTKLVDYWEKGFNGTFSFDISSSFKEVLAECLIAEGCIEMSEQRFKEVFFSDLGSNCRLTARITGDELAVSDEPSPETDVEYNYCTMDHIHFRVIDIDSSKSSKQIIVSSQKPCDNILAKEFVEQCMSSGELFAEDVMSINSHYSMYNVSIVNRTVLQYNDFIVHLDSVSKKSNQRYGRFSDVVHLTLHHPRLNETLHQLQSNVGDDFLIKSAAVLYQELISVSEHFSTVIDSSFIWWVSMVYSRSVN